MTRWSDTIKVFSTCPPSNYFESGTDYERTVEDVARWSDDAGCEGILVYTDNGLADPWLVAQRIIQHTTRLAPLVAIQPVYTHPYTIAKMVTSLAYLHGRRVYLNMVAGGFKNDLQALADETPHDDRYARLIEYTTIIQRLLAGPDAVTFSGRFHRVTNLKLTPPLPSGLMPGVFVSGSSDAGREAARTLGATAVEYPQPAEAYALRPADAAAPTGIRVGIVAREDGDEAWAVARARFPEDRRGQLAHQLAMKVSDSAWHAQLARAARGGATPDSPYWLHPFENYKTFCPYLVGSYDRVAAEIGRYLAAGYRTIILDVPFSREELEHIARVLERAATQAA